MDDYEAEAKKILIKKKHELHEETLMRIIQELQDLLVKHEKYAGPESIFAFARAQCGGAPVSVPGAEAGPRQT